MILCKFEVFWATVQLVIGLGIGFGICFIVAATATAILDRGGDK